MKSTYIKHKEWVRDKTSWQIHEPFMTWMKIHDKIKFMIKVVIMMIIKTTEAINDYDYTFYHYDYSNKGY